MLVVAGTRVRPVDGALVSGVDSTGRTVPLDIIPSVMAARISAVSGSTGRPCSRAILTSGRRSGPVIGR